MDAPPSEDTPMSTAPHDTAGPASEALVVQLAEQRVVAQRSLRSVLGVSRDEEDLVQEVLARLVVRLRQPGEVALSPWTWRVAHNLAVDHLRARRATPMDPVLLDREVGEGLDDDVIASELAAAVSDGLARLPDRQRHALVAQATLDGGRGGHAMVAAKLGVSPKAAESILARARHALRRELGEWVAVGAFAGWVARLVRRALKPTTLAARAALIASVAVGGTAAVVVATSHGGSRAPSPHAGASHAVPGSPVAHGSTPVVTVPAASPLSVGAALPTLPALTAPSTTLPGLPSLPTVTAPSPALPGIPRVAGAGPVAPSVTLPVTTTVPGVTLPRLP